MGKKSKFRKKVDWPPIEREYAAGQLSRAEISRQFSVSRPAIEKHMKAEQIAYGSVADSVRSKAHAKLISDPEGVEVAGEVAGLQPAKAVEVAARRSAEVIRSHRRDIQHLREKEELLLKELFDSPTKLWIGQYQGQVVTEVVGIAVTDRITAFSNLTNARKTRIGLERVAFNLDAENTDSGNSVADAIREAESCRLK